MGAPISSSNESRSTRSNLGPTRCAVRVPSDIRRLSVAIDRRLVSAASARVSRRGSPAVWASLLLRPGADVLMRSVNNHAWPFATLRCPEIARPATYQSCARATLRVAGANGVSLQVNLAFLRRVAVCRACRLDRCGVTGSLSLITDLLRLRNTGQTGV